MALLLQFRSRTKPKPFTNSFLLHLYSTSNSADVEPEFPVDATVSDDQTPRNSKSPFASYFSDLKESLKQKNPTTPSSSFTDPKFSPPRRPQSATVTMDAVRSKLQQFRNANPSSPSGDPSQQQVSFEELYKRNAEKLGGSMGNASSRPGKRSVDELNQSSKCPFASYFSDLKESLKQKNPTTPSSSFTDPKVSPPRPLQYNVSMDAVRSKLQQFQNANTSSPSGDPAQQLVSFQELYKRNAEKLGGSMRNASSRPGKSSVDELNQRLMRMRAMEEAEPCRGFASFESGQRLACLASQDEEKKPPRD